MILLFRIELRRCHEQFESQIRAVEAKDAIKTCKEDKEVCLSPNPYVSSSFFPSAVYLPHMTHF